MADQSEMVDGCLKTVRTVALLRRQIKSDGVWLDPVEEEDEIVVRRYSGPVGKVGLEAGITVNLGNFESAKIQVSCEMPCYVEEMDEVSQFVADYVTHRIDANLFELVSARSEPGRLQRIHEASKQDVFKPQKKTFVSKKEVDSTDSEIESSTLEWNPPEETNDKLF